MTRLPDISNLKINNAGAMPAKGDEMSEMKSIDGMSDLSKEVAKLSKILTDHIEKFACAFAKETGLDPTKIKMVQQSLDNGFGYKVWFEPFPSDSEIEMYRAGQERALAELAARDALIERLVHYGNILAAMTFPNKKDDFENTQIKIWYSLREKWQEMKGGEK